MKCFVCKKNSWESHYKDLFRCSNCGFIRAKEIYFKIKPEEVYGKDYFDKGQYANYKKERLALEQNFKNRLKDIIKHKREGKLLEIGCAYGYFLNLAKKNFIISGIDVNSQTTNIASKLTGIKTLTGDFLTQKFSKNTFDVVSLFDTIEHLQKPKAYLEKIHTLLKPGGIVAIETGDIDSLLAKVQKERWRLIDPSVHLTYFSTKTLRNLLENTGYRILSIKKVSFARSLIQITYRLGINNILRHLKLNFLEKFISNKNISINTYDIIFVIAQKQ